MKAEERGRMEAGGLREGEIGGKMGGRRGTKGGRGWQVVSFFSNAVHLGVHVSASLAYITVLAIRRIVL